MVPLSGYRAGIPLQKSAEIFLTDNFELTYNSIAWLLKRKIVLNYVSKKI